MSITKIENGVPVGSHFGCVLSTFDTWDSSMEYTNYFARVWNDEKGCVESMCYDSSFHGTPQNIATVDVTDEFKAKALAWYKDQKVLEFTRKAQEKAAEVYGGKVCKAIRGRKIAVGTVVEAIWVGMVFDRFKNCEVWKAKVRYPLNGTMTEVWVSACNLEVVNPGYYVETSESIERRAQSAAKICVG